MTPKKLNQLQMLEQSMQNLSMQKQQFQLQQVELESAIKELDNVEEAYKIVGNIMVFEIQKYLLSGLDQIVNDLWTACGEELAADLEDPDIFP